MTVFSYRESFLPSAFFLLFSIFYFEIYLFGHLETWITPDFSLALPVFPRADSSVVFGAVTCAPLSVRRDVFFRRVNKRRETTEKVWLAVSSETSGGQRVAESEETSGCTVNSQNRVCFQSSNSGQSRFLFVGKVFTVKMNDRRYRRAFSELYCNLSKLDFLTITSTLRYKLPEKCFWDRAHVNNILILHQYKLYCIIYKFC